MWEPRGTAWANINDAIAHREIAAKLRVYLDTAVLLNIADGKVTLAQLDALRHAFRERDAVLVVSSAHFMDVTRDTDHATDARVEAVGQVVESFEQRAFVMVNVMGAERHAMASRDSDGNPAYPMEDIQLRPLGNFAEARRACDGDRPLLSILGNAVTLEAEADRLRRGARTTPAERSAAIQMAPQIFAALRAGETAEQVAARFLPPDADPTARDQAVEAIRRILPVVDAAATFVEGERERTGLAMDEYFERAFRDPASLQVGGQWLGFPGGFDGWREVARVHAPGLAIAAALVRRNESNVTRTVGFGDRADQYHAMHVPYVDVATVDGNNHETIVRELQHVRRRRRCDVLRNPGRDISSILDSLLG